MDVQTMTFPLNTPVFRNASVDPSSALSACLRSMRHSAKDIARAIGRSPRTIENWRGQRTGLSAADLVALCRYDDVWVTLCELAGREPHAMTAEQLSAELVRRLKAVSC